MRRVSRLKMKLIQAPPGVWLGGKGLGMTIKQNITREAEQLGRTVRQALSDFAKETGMQAHIAIEWIATQQLSESSPTQMVGRIRVEVAGLSVDA